MTRRFSLWFCLLTVVSVLAISTDPLCATEDAQLAPAWRLATQGSFTDAQAAIPPTLDGPSARFTQAMLLLNRQPRSDENLVAAAGLLGELARDGGSAELRARSLYFQARTETLRDPDSAEAVRLTEQLWHDYPAESYGQRGMVHLLLMTFYAPEPREAVLAKVAHLEAQAGRLTDPVVRGHFHQVAARGYLHLGGADAEALSHLLQAETLGAARREARGDLQVSIGQLAAELSRPATARDHYTRFLREFPNDPRAYTVKVLLAALPAD